MGIYSIYIGKGIIIPVSMFVRNFKTQILEKINADEDEFPDPIKIFGEIVAEQLGQNFVVESVGHDAFESRHGRMDIFDDTEHQKAFEHLKKLREAEKTENGNLLPPGLEDYETIGCSDLMFIGVYKEIEANGGGEFDYYVKTSELLYGLAVLIPSLIKCYQELTPLNTSALDHLAPSCIWTFAPDCHCCG